MNSSINQKRLRRFLTVIVAARWRLFSRDRVITRARVAEAAVGALAAHEAAATSRILRTAALVQRHCGGRHRRPPAGVNHASSGTQFHREDDEYCRQTDGYHSHRSVSRHNSLNVVPAIIILVIIYCIVVVVCNFITLLFNDDRYVRINLYNAITLHQVHI